MLNGQIFEKLSEFSGMGTITDDSITSFDTWMKGVVKSGNAYPTYYAFNEMQDQWDSKAQRVKKSQSLMPVSYYCMRHFANNYKNPTDALIFKLTNKTGRPTITKEFYEYLFADSSPWRSAFPGLAGLKPDKNGIPDYIVWFDTKKVPAKTVANLFAAIRLHTCWGADWFFMRLRELGFKDEAAILLSSIFAWNGQTITTSNGHSAKFSEDPRQLIELNKFGASKTDMPFSTQYNPSGFQPLLVQKEPSTVSKSLMDKTPTQPNNFIWHGDKKAINADSLNTTSEEYKNSLIKIVPHSDPTGLHSAMKGKKKLSKATLSEIEDALYNAKSITL